MIQFGPFNLMSYTSNFKQSNTGILSEEMEVAKVQMCPLPPHQRTDFPSTSGSGLIDMTSWNLVWNLDL